MNGFLKRQSNMSFSPQHRQLMVEAQAHLREAEQLLQAILAEQSGWEVFEVACDALNVAAVKLRFIQIEASARDEMAGEVEAETEAKAEDDTLSPD